ncbi:MAG: carbon monoxide dehydrogenase, partial [Pseudomonadota bacterium]|nr:carbon monoxide dehydrogenase [Pseudomonadota bacterium]
MMITRFPSRASGPAERLAGFMAHLRGNGFMLGPQETAQALEALHQVDIRDMFEVRLALRALLVPDAEGWRRFDDLFDAYWLNAGKQKMGQAKSDHVKVQAQKPMLWQDHFGETRDGAEGVEDAPMTADPEGEEEAEGTDGQLIATRQDNLSKRDLRELMDEDSLRRAEEAAERL